MCAARPRWRLFLLDGGFNYIGLGAAQLGDVVRSLAWASHRAGAPSPASQVNCWSATSRLPCIWPSLTDTGLAGSTVRTPRRGSGGSDDRRMLHLPRNTMGVGGIPICRTSGGRRSGRRVKKAAAASLRAAIRMPARFLGIISILRRAHDPAATVGLISDAASGGQRGGTSARSRCVSTARGTCCGMTAWRARR